MTKVSSFKYPAIRFSISAPNSRTRAAFLVDSRLYGGFLLVSDEVVASADRLQWENRTRGIVEYFVAIPVFSQLLLALAT